MILHGLMGVAAGLAVVFGAGYCWRDEASWHRSAIKTGAMAGLAAAGVALGAPFWVVMGLALGALGDFCLSRPGTVAFLAGMGAFAAGHMAYAVYFWHVGPVPPLFVPLSVALLALVATTELWLAPHTGALRWPVRGYVVVITVMGIAALAQPVPLILIGAGLFIVSDVLLALALFVVPAASWHWVLAVTVWSAYWLGQFLILQGAVRPVLAA